MPGTRALVLFDIDGTLIRRAGPHHKDALVDAVREITGLATTFDGISTSGMLDRDLIRLLLLNVGAQGRDIDTWMPAIVRTAQERYVSTCPDLQDKTCPGVLDFLSALQQSQIPAGLVTGNLTAIGWKKMEAAGLRRFFAFGAFAERARTRAGLARIAMREARKKGLLSAGTVVSLVGDHPNDVQAAKLNGIRSIAVSTGVSPVEELASCSPDILVPDLRSLKMESLL